MNIVCIGLGLIGGSFALKMRRLYPNALVLGMDNNPIHLAKALEIGLIKGKATEKDLLFADLVMLSVPVDVATKLAPKLLNQLGENTLLADMGSTKNKICTSVEKHPKRGQFLAMHPIAGTEFSGPQSALESLFDQQLMILCDVEKTREDLTKKMISILEEIPMELKYMKSNAHDKHLAYVSHLSHVSSFMLGKTVLDLEKNEEEIFALAGSGFASTVRLAKSNPRTWNAIFKENKEEVLTSLKEYIENLKNFQKMLENDEFASLELQLKQTQRIKEVLRIRKLSYGE